jgi:hypothetical protein
MKDAASASIAADAEMKEFWARAVLFTSDAGLPRPNKKAAPRKGSGLNGQLTTASDFARLEDFAASRAPGSRKFPFSKSEKAGTSPAFSSMSSR